MTTLGIGLFAAALTSASFGAQAWKILRTRDTDALATSAWILTALAFAVWTTYGVLRREWPIIVPNALCFVLSTFILALKLLPLAASKTRRPEGLKRHAWAIAGTALGEARPPVGHRHGRRGHAGCFCSQHVLRPRPRPRAAADRRERRRL
jgi:MtN3 and saliva related transmembrane protein